MPRKSKYGNMPPRPTHVAKVKGDAGVYEVWGRLDESPCLAESGRT